MSKAIDEALALIEESVPNLYKVKAVRVCVGWGYVGVKLSTGHVGICHSLLEEQVVRCCRIAGRAGGLAGSPAIGLARLAKSWGPERERNRRSRVERPVPDGLE